MKKSTVNGHSGTMRITKWRKIPQELIKTFNVHLQQAEDKNKRKYRRVWHEAHIALKRLLNNSNHFFLKHQSATWAANGEHKSKLRVTIPRWLAASIKAQ